MKIKLKNLYCRSLFVYQKGTWEVAICAAVALSGSIHGAEPLTNAPVSNDELLKIIQAMDSRIKTLESQLQHNQNATNALILPSEFLPGSQPEKTESEQAPGKKPWFGLGYRSEANLRIGSYGELKFGGMQTPTGWQNGFDGGRVVLLPTYQMTDNIIFNAEIEFEHGGIARDADDKQNGAAGIEQAYVDFKFNDYLNWRAPGVDVVPFGYINLFHEPTQFYSVQRPELYNGLIPSTWFEGSTSLYGKIVDNLNYQFQISTSLEDAGTTGSLPPGGYDPGISGTEALTLARAPIGDFTQLNSNLGYALRLSYTPPFAPGLAGSSSVYYTPSVTPRGAYVGADGRSLGNSSLTFFDTELHYRIPHTGFELRGEYVQAFFGNPKNLRANNDGDAENNVGSSMWGASIEAAYHWDLSSKIKNGWELVPFYRYTYEDLQMSGFRGTDANEPTGQGKRQFHTFGLALFPTPKLVLKLDYQRALDQAPDSPHADHVLGAVGFFF